MLMSLDELIPQAGAIYVMDRGYLDFARLYTLSQHLAFFVIRSKINTKFRRIYSRNVDKTTGLKCDQTIALTGVKTATAYPDKLRRVKFVDNQNGKRLSFLSNNFTVSALTIAELYRCRWQVELFFKWIKQHLRIKTFYGTSENAVKAQIWIAVSVYVLVAIVRKRLMLTHVSLYTILQVLSVTLFEKLPIYQLVTSPGYTYNIRENAMQLKLFDY